MDKQEAIQYIQTRLDQDLTHEEIVRGLTDALHAPQPVVEKFVAQVERDYRKPKPPPEPVPPQEVKLPPWLAELTIGQSAANIEPAADAGQQPALADQQPALADQQPALAGQQPAPAGQGPATPPQPTANGHPSWETEARAYVTAQLRLERLHSDIASELTDRFSMLPDEAESLVSEVAAQVASPPLPPITDTTQAAEFVKGEYSRGTPHLAIATQLAMRTGEPQELTEKFVAQTIANLEKSGAQGEPFSPNHPAVDWDNPELVKFVIGEFGKQRKRSDIVMALCERTGAEWSEAQRFVGQVNAEYQSRINARKNRLVIPMSIGAIVLGLVFTLGAAYPVIIWLTRGANELSSLAGSTGGLSNFIQAAPYLFFVGIALFAGGLIGLIIAVRSQLS